MSKTYRGAQRDRWKKSQRFHQQRKRKGEAVFEDNKRSHLSSEFELEQGYERIYHAFENFNPGK